MKQLIFLFLLTLGVGTILSANAGSNIVGYTPTKKLTKVINLTVEEQIAFLLESKIPARITPADVYDQRFFTQTKKYSEPALSQVLARFNAILISRGEVDEIVTSDNLATYMRETKEELNDGKHEWTGRKKDLTGNAKTIRDPYPGEKRRNFRGEIVLSCVCTNTCTDPLYSKIKSSEKVDLDELEYEYKPVVYDTIFHEKEKIVYVDRPSAPAPAVKAGCWDLNSNGVGDLSEDKNHDGVCDNNDCDVENRDDRKVVKTEGGNITITIYNDRNGNSQPAAPVQPVAPQPAVTWYQPAMNPQLYYPPQQNMGGGFWNNPYALGWGNLAVNTGFGIWDRIASYFNQNQNYCGMQGNPWRGDYPVDRPIDRTPVGFTPQMWDPVTVNNGGNNNTFNPNMYGTVRPNR